MRLLSLVPIVISALTLSAPGFAAVPETGSEPTGAEGPAWTVQVDPLTTWLGFVHVQVERRLAPKLSLYVGPSLRLFSAPFTDPEDYVGYGGEAGVRFYPWGTAPRGWWALGRGVVAHLRAGEESALGAYGSVLGGHSWIFGDWFVASLGLGVQYLHYRVAGLGLKGVLPAAHTTIGFAF